MINRHIFRCIITGMHKLCSWPLSSFDRVKFVQFMSRRVLLCDNWPFCGDRDLHSWEVCSRSSDCVLKLPCGNLLGSDGLDLH